MGFLGMPMPTNLLLCASFWRYAGHGACKLLRLSCLARHARQVADAEFLAANTRR